jgi:5'-phosphate synthase pdxT subunit
VRQGHLLAATFHPELSSDRRVHRYFVDMVREANDKARGASTQHQEG